MLNDKANEHVKNAIDGISSQVGDLLYDETCSKHNLYAKYNYHPLREVWDEIDTQVWDEVYDFIEMQIETVSVLNTIKRDYAKEG